MAFSGSILALLAFTSLVWGQFSGTYKHGVGIGGWLLTESWMYPDRWKQMGGERCDEDASRCVSAEWALVNKLGQQRADEVFRWHWQTWFTQEHVDQIKARNLDHVRISLGFWIIEELVQAPEEVYARGGWIELKRGLRQLKSSGINVLLNMHALPGVAASNQLFAGKYTKEMHFYEDGNYRRALTWIVILTAMSHLDPDFQRVLGIMCVNEPDPDPHNTPGLGQYYADFVTTVRLVEYALGVNCDVDLSPALQRMVKSNNVLPGLLAAIPLLPIYASKATPGLDVSPLTRTLTRWCHQNASAVTSPTLAYSDQNAASAQAQPGPILPSYLPALGPSDSSSYSQSMVLTTPATNATTDATISRSTRYASSATETVDVHVSADTYASTHGPHRRRSHLGHSLTRIFRRANHHQRDVRPPRSPMGGQPFCLTTVAMPKRWQWAGDGESMAPHVLGPRAFNDHLYFSFGGVANATYESYLDTICSWNGYEIAKNNSEIPYGTGEFSLATNFNVTVEQHRGWGDAQKYTHGKESFWTMWNFRIEEPTDVERVKLADEWSYLRATERGLITKNPSELFNPSICKGRETRKKRR